MSDNNTNNSSPSSTQTKQLGLIAMTLMVISAMFGGGIFNIPQNMAQSAALAAILIAWVVTGLSS